MSSTPLAPQGQPTGIPLKASNEAADLFARALPWMNSSMPLSAKTGWSWWWPWLISRDASGNPADINDDGQVNIADLLAVILAWGPCAIPQPTDCQSYSCAADIRVNGAVDVADLLMVIVNWG